MSADCNLWHLAKISEIPTLRMFVMLCSIPGSVLAIAGVRDPQQDWAGESPRVQVRRQRLRHQHAEESKVVGVREEADGEVSKGTLMLSCVI